MNRQSVLTISKSNFRYNIKQIRNYIGENKDIIPVIKANGYGTYVNKCLELIEEFKIVAVACVCEAIELREIGYVGKILVLNQPYLEDIENILKYDVVVGVADIGFIKALGEYDKNFEIHLELETGMGRTGIDNKDISSFLEEVLKYENIKVTGIYTHFAAADDDYDYTNYQIKLFEDGVKKIEKVLGSVEYVHAAASNGLINFKIDFCNYVRAGIIMYGFPAANDTLDKIDIKPIAKLSSKISFIKEVVEGVSISYGRTYITKEKKKIATVGIGYADGIRRGLSNKGEVLVNGEKCLIVGRVCMDSMMIDVTHLDEVNIGDIVYIWDNDKISLEDVADNLETINYEVISTISSRVPRVFEE